MTVALSSILLIQPNGCFQALERPLSVSKQAVTRTDMPATGTRIEQKERTRQRICEAALSLIGQGRSFTSLSLREITREAGIVPAAFYRHFSDMDQLGLALVEMGGVTLRLILREAGRDGIPGRLEGIADRRDDAHAGDDDATLAHAVCSAFGLRSEGRVTWTSHLD